MENFIAIHNDATPQPLAQEPPPARDFDPSKTAAACLIALEAQPLATASVEAALKLLGEQIAGQDLSAMEHMLAAQAQVLNGIFAKATVEYADSRRDDHIRIHSAVALRSQNHCRMTVAVLAKIQNEKQALAAKNPKPQNELFVAPATA